jgi:uncharacterized membrane protein YeaQ/YmgE (transglycosylase-associated protein family)
MTNIIYFIIIGFIAGGLAKFLMPGKDPGGLIITILLGIAGSVVGGYVGKIVGIAGNGLLGSIIVATGGAFLLLLLYRLLFKPNRR